jgi:hypothetical protein
MLDEFVLVPDIFDASAYSKPDYADICLATLKEPLLREALVRDLCDGRWSQCCREGTQNLHRLAAEILRKLGTANRLRRFPLHGSAVPACSADWCQQAIDTANVEPLTGIIAAHATKQAFAKAPSVASIEKLPGASWWQGRSTSWTVDRKTPELLKLLDRVLTQANSLMFIDPNLDPDQRNYREFFELLRPLSRRSLRPRVELHRSFCRGDGASRSFPTFEQWRKSFASLDAQLKNAGLSAEVFLWQDFHDRYLITDVLGVTVGAGFDVSRAPNDETTWARLGTSDREKFQRRFDPASRSSDLKGRFAIGV